MVNFLALLGWSPGDDRELLSREELIESFTLEEISGGNAVFNTEKLDWMNGQYIARLPIDRARTRRAPVAGRGRTWQRSPVTRRGSLPPSARAAPTAREATDRFRRAGAPLLSDTVEYEPAAVEKHLGVPNLLGHITALAATLHTTTPFDEPQVEKVVRGTAERLGIKAGPLIHATRVALTGRTTSPGLFELIVLLGRDESMARLERLATFLPSRSQHFLSKNCNWAPPTRVAPRSDGSTVSTPRPGLVGYG